VIKFIKGVIMMEESTDVQVLSTVDGVYTDMLPDTLEIPEIENPDEREYENVELEQEGGL
jgi:hypothetical protein